MTFFISEFRTTVAYKCSCYEQMTELLQKKMDNMKKSILYDVRKGFQDLQNNLLLNLTPKHEINIASFIKENIGIPLPTCTLDNFYSLDSLMETNKHKDALVSIVSLDFLYYIIFLLPVYSFKAILQTIIPTIFL